MSKLGEELSRFWLAVRLRDMARRDLVEWKLEARILLAQYENLRDFIKKEKHD